MKVSDNSKVNEFLADLRFVSSDESEIIESIREIFLNANPELLEDIKYGGLVFNLSGELVGGVFHYKEHISVEFSNGADLPDPSGVLEGKGKKRRHLKISEKQDIVNKDVSFFVEESVKT